MNDRIEVFRNTVSALASAAARLRVTHDGVAGLFPLDAGDFESLGEAQRERLDAYSVRYARCQDLLYPAMRALGRAQMEPKADRSFLELLALMQKQDLVGSIEDWERQRSLRNAISHEYPDADDIVEILAAIREAAPELLSYVDKLKDKVASFGMD